MLGVSLRLPARDHQLIQPGEYPGLDVLRRRSGRLLTPFPFPLKDEADSVCASEGLAEAMGSTGASTAASVAALLRA